jgi:hypothetical protein
MRWVGHVARVGRGEVHTGFWWENLKERDHLEDQGIVGRTILNGFAGSRWGVMDWIDLSQDRDRWRALVNVVVNLQVP